MANDSNVIREFFVALGYKQDEAGLKKFVAGIEAATKTVLALGVAVESMAVGVAIGVTRFANNLEALYFASQRVGASAVNLKAIDRAAQGFGASAGEALQSVEGLARFLRNNPSAEGYLNSFLFGTGKTVADAHGDTVLLTEFIAKAFQLRKEAGQGYLNPQYANLFGISEKMMLAMLNGDFVAKLEEYRSILAGAGVDEAARNAHEFNEQMRVLEERIQSIRIKIGNGLLKAFTPELEQLSNWFDKHAEDITKWVTGFADGITKFGSIALPVLGKVAEGWGKIYEVMKDWGEQVAKDHPDAQGGETVGWLLDALGIRKQVDELLELEGKPSSDLMTFFRRKGWSEAQAAGIVANIEAESQQNPGAIGDGGEAYGLGQWHKDRQALFRQWAGHDIQGSSTEEQAGFYDWELRNKYGAVAEMLRGAQTPEQAAAIISRGYERPAAADAEAKARGELAASLVQHTTITVNGGDAAATGAEVARQQDSVNDDMIRNVKAQLQ